MTAKTFLDVSALQGKRVKGGKATVGRNLNNWYLTVLVPVIIKKIPWERVNVNN
jgi:hypothetical protein